jgi:hypothetical protein
MTSLVETIRITIRPSVDIPFFKWSDDFILSAEENFVTTNKILHYIIQLSEDGLIETRTGIWENDEYYMDFVHMGITFNEWENRENYNLLNGIVDSIGRNPASSNSIDELVTSPIVNLRSVVP